MQVEHLYPSLYPGPCICSVFSRKGHEGFYTSVKLREASVRTAWEIIVEFYRKGLECFPGGTEINGRLQCIDMSIQIAFLFSEEN